MQDKQGKGRLPAQNPRVLVAPRYKRRARFHDREKNGHTARKGGQNPAYRTRTASSISIPRSFEGESPRRSRKGFAFPAKTGQSAARPVLPGFRHLRQFMEARFKTQADERALALLNEQIAVQEERVRISNEKLQQAFDKKETREVRMPFDGRVQYHISPPAGEENTMPVAQTGPLLTAVDDAQLYVAVTPQEAEVVKLPPERLVLKLDLGGGKFFEARWHHKKVEQRNRQETLVYYFALSESDREQAWDMVGANTVAELHYQVAEGEEVLYLHKHELASSAGTRAFESWEELVAALRPEYEIVFTGETHICLKKKP